MFETGNGTGYGKSIPSLGSTVIAPDASRMVLALRQIGYSLEQALADLIDNSINAKAGNVLIRFIWEDESIVSMMIIDDGLGMSPRDIDNAMRFGSQRVENIASLGKYGMGMKLASLSHARAMTVVTKKSKTVCGRRWTIEGIENGWSCEALNEQHVRRVMKLPWGKLDLSSGGTIVVWDDIDKLPTGAKGLKHTLQNLQKRLQLHLGLYFHRFIETGKVRILLDQQQLGAPQQPFCVEIKPLDPFGYPQSGCSEHPKRFTAEIRGVGKLHMHAHIWPPNSDLPEYKLGNRAAARQGFYFYRNDRLIQAGGWNGIVQSDNEPHSSLARVSIDLPAKYDSVFGLNVQKSAIVVPPDFERAVVESKEPAGGSFEGYRVAAQQVYRKLDGRALREQPCIVGKGIPGALRKYMVSAMKVEAGEGREIAFSWGNLLEDQLFDIDPKGSRIILNRQYRDELAGDEPRTVNDAPMLKVLLFFLLKEDLKSERLSQNRRERWAMINKALTCCINK